MTEDEARRLEKAVRGLRASYAEAPLNVGVVGTWTPTCVWNGRAEPAGDFAVVPPPSVMVDPNLVDRPLLDARDAARRAVQRSRASWPSCPNGDVTFTWEEGATVSSGRGVNLVKRRSFHARWVCTCGGRR